MKKSSILLLFLLFSTCALFAQPATTDIPYSGVTLADFDRKTNTTGAGQLTKLYFKFLPKKSSAVNTYFADNFEWHAFIDKTGKFSLNDALLTKGFLLKINHKLENLGAFQARVYSRSGDKIKNEKLSKKLIEKEVRGDSTFILFRFDGYSNADICEITYSTKAEVTNSAIVIRGNELSTLHYSRVEIVIPEFLELDVDLRTTNIATAMSREEKVRESMKFDNYSNENEQPKISNETVNYGAVKKTIFIDNVASPTPSNMVARVISKKPVLP